MAIIEELKKQEDTLRIVEFVARLSSMYELENTSLKKAYMQQEIENIKNVFKLSSNYRGTFGTGYPFYAVGDDMKYDLPVILEQLRYNTELIEECRKQDTRLWACFNCLEEKIDEFPNLKIYCKHCTALSDELKPRKVINRIPDLDIWCVAKKRTTLKICDELSHLLEHYAELVVKEGSVENGDVAKIFKEEEINIDLNCIKGAIISLEQTMDLIGLLGVKIKE